MSTYPADEVAHCGDPPRLPGVRPEEEGLPELHGAAPAGDEGLPRVAQEAPAEAAVGVKGVWSARGMSLLQCTVYDLSTLHVV